MKSFWKGFFSIFNIFPTQTRRVRKSMDEDLEKIGEDWKTIESDIKKVISDHG